MSSSFKTSYRLLSVRKSVCRGPFRRRASGMEGEVRVPAEEGAEGGQDVRKVVRRRRLGETLGRQEQRDGEKRFRQPWARVCLKASSKH